MRLKLKKQQRFILLAALSGLLVIAIALVYIPLYRDFLKLKTRLKVKQAGLELTEQKLRASSQEDTGRIIYLKEVPQALDELTKSALAKGIEFVSIKQQEPEKIDPSFSMLPVLLELNSPFKPLSEFLGSLETLKNSVTVVNYLEAERNDQEPQTVNVKLRLGIYLYSE